MVSSSLKILNGEIFHFKTVSRNSVIQWKKIFKSDDNLLINQGFTMSKSPHFVEYSS